MKKVLLATMFVIAASTLFYASSVYAGGSGDDGEAVSQTRWDLPTCGEDVKVGCGGYYNY